MRHMILIGLLICQVALFAQDSLDRKYIWGYSGYVKDLEWVRFEKDFSNGYATNLLHHRFNLKWIPTQQLSGRLEVRNRLYWGDDVRLTPGFNKGLKNGNEAADLSATWLRSSSVVLHSNVERLWLEYKRPKWNLRTGRQRINWGITNTWNPNDLFNTYNFLDFDYEERPGSDAIKGQYILNDLSNLEMAVAGTGNHTIAAAKYFTNYRKYDLQWIIGRYSNAWTAGFGWAGSIKDIGLKGEAQYYAGDKGDSLSRFNLTIEGDYMYQNGWYLLAAVLYNEKGLNAPLYDEDKIVFQASPRNLMPTRWNVLFNTTKEFTPRFSFSNSVVFAPGVNMLILFPSLKYNLKPNLDADFIWQSFFAEQKVFGAISHTGFIRVRWSY